VLFRSSGSRPPRLPRSSGRCPTPAATDAALARSRSAQLKPGTLVGRVTRSTKSDRRGSRAIIAGLVSAKSTDTDERVRAPTIALESRGFQVVGTLVQRRGVSRAKGPGGAHRLDAPMSPATFIGEGKAEELSLLVREARASVVYFLNALSSAQIERLSALTGCEVVSGAERGARRF